MPRTVVVTGTSSGLGAAIACHLDKRGHTVIGTSRTASADAGIVAAGMTRLPLDVRSDQSVALLRDTLVRSGVVPDVLVLNAGIAMAGSLEETPVSGAEALFQTNFFGVHRVVQAFLPYLRARRSGRVIIIGSLGGRMPLPFQGFYSASKAAVAAYAAVLRQELAPYAVAVVLIEPGDFRTEVDRNRAVHGDIEAGPYAPVAGRAMVLLRRYEAEGGHPHRIARLVGRVVEARSPRAGYICGSALEHLAAAVQCLLPASWFNRILASRYR